MRIKTAGAMEALAPINFTNVKKGEQVVVAGDAINATGYKRILCKSVRTGIWLLAKRSRVA